MLSSVELNINDSMAGAGGGTGTGAFCVIGVSSTESSSPIAVRSSMDTNQIRETLGKSPLADACIDAIDGGASLIYCLPVKATTKGKFSEVEVEGTSDATISVSGEPTNEFSVKIRIESTGAVNEATCSISEDGGTTWGDEMTIPLSGEYELLNTGVKLKFASEESKKFQAGDVFSFTATAPAASNEDIITAAKKLLNYTGAYEWIYVKGVTTAALWSSLATVAMQWEKESGRPIFFIVEQRNAAAEEDTAAYVEAIEKDAKGVKSRHIVVVRTWMRYVRLDGKEQDINFAGVFCGWLARTKESTSTAFVQEFSLPEGKVVKLLPEGIEDYMEVLEAARYVELRTYNGLEGYYVASANTTAPESSDFSKVEDVRVAYRIARETYKRALLHQSEDFDQTDIETALIQVEADLNVPQDEATADKIISNGKTRILIEEMNSGRDKTLPVRIEYVPRGYLRKIILNMYVVNVLSE